MSDQYDSTDEYETTDAPEATPEDATEGAEATDVTPEADAEESAEESAQGCPGDEQQNDKHRNSAEGEKDRGSSRSIGVTGLRSFCSRSFSP